MLNHYIGESDKEKERYLDDFERYVINGEEGKDEKVKTRKT